MGGSIPLRPICTPAAWAPVLIVKIAASGVRPEAAPAPATKTLVAPATTIVWRGWGATHVGWGWTLGTTLVVALAWGAVAIGLVGWGMKGGELGLARGFGSERGRFEGLTIAFNVQMGRAGSAAPPLQMYRMCLLIASCIVCV